MMSSCKTVTKALLLDLSSLLAGVGIRLLISWHKSDADSEKKRFGNVVSMIKQ